MNLFKSPACIVVAEISANHGQSLNRALEMIKRAKACGVDAVKFQAYTPDTLTIDASNKYFRVTHPEWGGQTLYKLYTQAFTPWSWFKKLKRAASNEGLFFFSTAFDKTSVDFLEALGVPVHKIASFELVDIPLIEYTASKRKPLILSTGMASLAEIKEAVRAARTHGAGKLMLLKCVSSYPAKPQEMNLRTIPDMRKRFKCAVGFSDHSLEFGASLAALTQGARLIEKHFTLSRKLKTPDSFFSLEPQELKTFVTNLRIVEASLGNIHYGATQDEKKSLAFRRSLFVIRDIRAGEAFNCNNIRSIRPGNGLAPKYLKTVLGSRAKVFLRRGTPLQKKHIR